MNTVCHFILWKLGLAAATTQTTDAERDCLAKHATGRRCVVEIGVWHGVTTSRLLQAMAPDGILFAVDPYPPGRLGVSFPQWIAHRQVKQASNGRVRWIRSTGAEAARAFPSLSRDLADFLFIDGDHSYEGIRQDWEGWSPLVAPDGVVALHDSNPTPTHPIEEAGSVQYTRQVILHDPRFQLLEVVDSLTVLRRVGTNGEPDPRTL
jgi:predicted O-methyltransferase YrrM